MTAEQSKNLKAGDHVCFNSDPADLGTVIATESRYVTITWQDGRRSLTGHRNMTRVRLVRVVKETETRI
jgi:hypothetical protein